MQPSSFAESGLKTDPARARGNLARVALVLSAAGLVLCGAAFAGMIVIVALPRSDFSMSYAWLALVACGGIGLWPGVVGLVLGLVALTEAKKHGEPHRSAWRAIAFGAAGPVAIGLGFFALWLNAWLA